MHVRAQSLRSIALNVSVAVAAFAAGVVSLAIAAQAGVNDSVYERDPGMDTSGIPVSIDTAVLPKRVGPLRCSNSEDACVVNNLRRLSQSDQALDIPLIVFLDKLPGAKFAALKASFANPDSTEVPQNPPFTTKQVVSQMKGAGCYGTSIATVALAAYENRGASVAPPKVGSRTETFFGVGTNGNIPWGLKPYAQVAWTRSLNFLDSYSAQLGVPHQETFGLPEVVADIGGGIKERCDPHKFNDCQQATAVNNAASWVTLTNLQPGQFQAQTIIDKMRQGYVMLIGYSRFTAVVDRVRGPRGDEIRSVFKTGLPPHKVVIYGFAPGEYPLLVQNVGNNTLHAAKIVTDLKGLRFTVRNLAHPNDAKADKGLMLPIETVDGGQVAIDPAYTHSVFLVFKSDTEIKDRPVLRLDFAEGLRISTK